MCLLVNTAGIPGRLVHKHCQEKSSCTCIMLLYYYLQDDPIPALSYVLISLPEGCHLLPSCTCLFFPCPSLPVEAVTCVHTLLYAAQVQCECLGKTLLRLASELPCWAPPLPSRNPLSQTLESSKDKRCDFKYRSACKVKGYTGEQVGKKCSVFPVLEWVLEKNLYFTWRNRGRKVNVSHSVPWARNWTWTC